MTHGHDAHPADNPGQRRKLIEVALPLEAINAASKAYKDRKTGSIRSIHKWFAPMPAPAWRVLLSAALIDDPETAEERKLLLTELERLVPSNGLHPDEASLQAISGLFPDTSGLVVLDPFCGGGSTLVEAQRLGLASFGGDLNPVPALISHFLVQIAPQVASVSEPILASAETLDIRHRYAAFIADAAYLADEIRSEVWSQVASSYDEVDGTRHPIGWLWAHVVPCGNPACEMHVPLVSSCTLLKQRNRNFFLALEPDGAWCRPSVVQQQTQHTKPTKTPGPRGRFACPACQTPFGVDYIKEMASRNQLREQLLCRILPTPQGRVFEPPEDLTVQDIAPSDDTWDIDIPTDALGFTVAPFGYTTFGQLFPARQRRTYSLFAQAIASAAPKLRARGCDKDYSDALVTFLALCLGRMAQGGSKQVRWRVDSRSGSATAEATFSRQVITMVWDYVETNPFGGSTGDWTSQVGNAARAFDHLPHRAAPATVVQEDARLVGNRVSRGSALVATDPPYFDAIGYADLSDFFYIWLRQALRETIPQFFGTVSTPKQAELIADPGRWDGNTRAAFDYFVNGFTETFHSLREAADPSLPMIVVYAQRADEQEGNAVVSTGWEALLRSVFDAGLQVTGTWPIHGTGSSRQRGYASNAMASYVVLICRVRETSAPAVTRRAFLAALESEMVSAVSALTAAGVAPLDLAQAALGPGMSVYSRFSRVLEPDGSEMSVRTALALINQSLDEVLAVGDSDLDVETRFCLRWFDQFGWSEEGADKADALARTTNTSLAGLERAGVFIARAGRARLIGPDDIDLDYDVTRDRRVTVWEVALHAAVVLDRRGAGQASEALVAARSRVDLEAVRQLGYGMFNVAERRGWRPTAALFNGLGTSWGELLTAPPPPIADAQHELDFDEDKDA